MHKLLILAASLLLLALPAHAGGKSDKYGNDSYSSKDGGYERGDKPGKRGKKDKGGYSDPAPSQPDPSPPARSEPSRSDNGQTSRCGLFVKDPHCPQGARSQRILKGLWPF